MPEFNPDSAVERYTGPLPIYLSSAREMDHKYMNIPIKPLFIEEMENVKKDQGIPRQTTLLNELRVLLVNYTPAERVAMFEMMTQDYCDTCGHAIRDGVLCQCDHYPQQPS